MNHSARNPVRRNRNIGTKKSGHGQDNKLVIPDPRGCLAFYERLGKHSAFKSEIRGRQLTFVVEKTRADTFHACTIDDVRRMFESIPADDWDGIEYIVFRQAKRKEELLKPTWGRLDHIFTYLNRSAPAIILETVSYEKPTRWSRNLDPEDRSELERLRKDGVCIVETKRYFLVKPTLESTRKVQLYRTLLHEVGHWADYNRVTESDYESKSSRDIESFAHAYSTKLANRLRRQGVIPFSREWSGKWEGLDVKDFFPEGPLSPRT